MLSDRLRYESTKIDIVNPAPQSVVEHLDRLGARYGDTHLPSSVEDYTADLVLRRATEVPEQLRSRALEIAHDQRPAPVIVASAPSRANSVKGLGRTGSIVELELGPQVTWSEAVGALQAANPPPALSDLATEVARTETTHLATSDGRPIIGLETLTPRSDSRRSGWSSFPWAPTASWVEGQASAVSPTAGFSSHPGPVSRPEFCTTVSVSGSAQWGKLLLSLTLE